MKQECEYLEMADGYQARTWEELFEHFDTENVLEHFDSGRFLKWLKKTKNEGGRGIKDNDFRRLVSLHRNAANHYRFFRILFHLCDRYLSRLDSKATNCFIKMEVGERIFEMEVERKVAELTDIDDIDEIDDFVGVPSSNEELQREHDRLMEKAGRIQKNAMVKIGKLLREAEAEMSLEEWVHMRRFPM